MEIQEYIEKRFYDQLRYYETAALRAKTRALYLRMIQMIALTATPMLLMLEVYLPSYGWGRMIALTSSIVAMLVTTILNAFNSETQWQQFRFVVEQLKKEHTSFTLGLGEYAELPPEKRGRLFIERSESVMAGEMSRWFVGPDERKMAI